MSQKKKFNYLLNQKSGTLFIIFIVLATFIVVAYFTWWSDNTIAVNSAPETEQKQNINQLVEPEKYYTEDGLDMVVQGYDEELVTKLENEEMVNYDFNSEGNISVMPEDYEEMIKNSVGIKSETDIIIDGQKATKIIGSSAKDGSLITMILIKKNGQLYVFKGEDQFLNSLDQIINFKD